jgi:hypothetical protein
MEHQGSQVPGATSPRKLKTGVSELVGAPAADIIPPVATRSGRVVSKPKHFTDFAAANELPGVPAS